MFRPRKHQSPTITITDTPNGLAIIFGKPHSPKIIPLPSSGVERALTDTLLCTRANISPKHITTHLTDHTTTNSSKCPCCILTGRILSAQGRKPISSIIPLPSRNRATVQIRHIPPNKSGAQILALLTSSTLRSTPPQSTIVARTKHRLEDLM